MKKILLNFHNDVARLARYYRTMEVVFWIEAFWCFLRYGASPNDYIRYEFYKKRGREINEFITAKRQRLLTHSLNSIKGERLEDDKLATNKRLNQFIKREWLYVHDGIDVQEVLEFVKCKGQVIVKPLHLSGGEGIYKLDASSVSDEKLRLLNHEEVLIEEYIHQHSDMAAFNPSSVNTLRIFTIVNENLEVDIIDAIVRMGASISCVDNACAGGLFAEVDIESGIVMNRANTYTIDGRLYLFHPLTNCIIPGRQIPSWSKVCEMAINVAKELMIDGRRYVASDIAVTEEGEPELIEVNWFGDSRIRQRCSGYPVGKWKEMKKYL